MNDREDAKRYTCFCNNRIRFFIKKNVFRWFGLFLPAPLCTVYLILFDVCHKCSTWILEVESAETPYEKLASPGKGFESLDVKLAAANVSTAKLFAASLLNVR